MLMKTLRTKLERVILGSLHLRLWRGVTHELHAQGDVIVR